MADRALPQRSRQQRVSSDSMAWFERAIDGGLFVVRRVNEHDYGVDYELEAVTEEVNVTNLRFQVQLKSTEDEPNKDGSVSVSVAVANLNYLMNQSGSVYVLADVPRKRLLYRRAADVLREYEEGPRDLSTQDSCTVRFREAFDGSVQRLLHAELVEEGNLRAEARFGWGDVPRADWGTRALDSTKARLPVPPDPWDAAEVLHGALSKGYDELVFQNRAAFRRIHGNNLQVQNLLATAAVNLAMRGIAVDPEEYRRAVDVWLRVAAALPEHRAGLLYNVGNAYSALAEFELAAQQYRASLALEETAENYKNLGTALERLGREDEALSAFGRALELDPSLPEGHFALATRLQREGEWEESLRHLRMASAAVRSSADDARLNALLLRSLVEVEAWGESISVGRRLLQLVPGERWAWLRVATAVSLAWRAERSWLTFARGVFEAGVGRSDADGDVWFELGFICRAQDEDCPSDDTAARAREAFLEAASRGCSDPGLAWDRLGHMEERLSRPREALDAFERAADLDPVRFGYCLGVALLGDGKYVEAVDWLRAAAHAHQPDALSYHNLGVALAHAGDTEDAVDALRVAVELDPDDEGARFDLGGELWNSGRREEALGVWQKALDRFPDSPLREKLVPFVVGGMLDLGRGQLDEE